MFNLKRKFQYFVASAFIGIILSSPVLSDDTEVFFGQAKDINMLLVLDESGSMDRVDDGSSPVELVAPWVQTGDANIADAIARLPSTEVEPRARFAILQMRPYSSYPDYYVDYTERNVQFGDLWWVDLNRVYNGYSYRWIYKNSRMTQLKEALYIFLNDPNTEDSQRIGMMTYTSSRTPYSEMLLEVKALGEVTGTKTHRERLIDALAGLSPFSGTPTGHTYYNATQYFASGYGGFNSPITNTGCGYTNSIVLLTDGIPNTFTSTDRNNIKEFKGESCSSSDDGKECTIELSAYSFANDIKPGVTGSKIQTATIAFALKDATAKKFLQDTASTVDNKKLFFEPTNAADLARAFSAALESAKDSTTFVAPSVPLSQSNRLRHSNNLYLGMFKPDSQQNWFGNLKKYELENGKIIDKNGVIAVDPSTGKFITSSTSFWNNVADGNKVTLGGALPRIQQETATSSPDIYTNLNTNSLNKIDDSFITDYISTYKSEADFLDKLFGSDEKSNIRDLSDAQVTEYFEWIKDRLTTVDGNNLDRFGDVLHSRPQILEYDANTSTAFVATNQGYIHAIDIATGNERWAFFPRQLMKNVPGWVANTGLGPSDSRSYGMDGPLTIYSYKDATGKDRHILYAGMRRGGNYVFALDVTLPESPKMIFTVGNEFDFTRTELGYNGTNDVERRTVIPNLGQTWGKPVVAKLPRNNNAGYARRLILAGGYDEYYDNRANAINPANNTILGDGIYDIPFKGSVNSDNNYLQLATENNISNSIAADVTLLDLNNDGIVDNIYAADVAGKVYRLDFKAGVTTNAVEVFADVSGDASGSYRFYNKPDVAFATYKGESFAIVALGSGHRPNPKAKTTRDKFYAFYDFEITGTKSVSSALTISDLYNVTNVGSTTQTFATVEEIRDPQNPKDGWYFELEVGEKVLSGATTINFVSFFTTFKPQSGTASCLAAAGNNRLYGVNLVDGSPGVKKFNQGTVDSTDDRYNTVEFVGIAPGVTLLFPDDTSIATLVGTQTICSGQDCDFLPSGVKTVKWKQTE